MKEIEVKIRTPDKKVIYGTLGRAKKKAGTLVVFVHGFTGHQNEHIFFNGSKLFAQKGLDTFRFDLYTGGKKGARHFRDTSISVHGKDINAVVKFFRNKYKCLLVFPALKHEIYKIPEQLQPFFFRRQNLPYKFPNAAFIPYSK